MARTFRSLYRWLVPSWINDGDEGTKVLHALSTIIDAQVQRVHDSLVQRFPSYAGPSALRKIGQDRLIMRGRSETDEAYAARLLAWRSETGGHRTRGNVPSLLTQISAYLGSVHVWEIDRSGNKDDLLAPGVWIPTRVTPLAWDSRPATEWARFWIGIDSSVVLSAGDVATITSLLYGAHPWRTAGTQPEWMIQTLDGSNFAPATGWVRWGYDSDGVYSPIHDDNFRRWSLDPPYNNTYGGNPALFPEAILSLEVTQIVGDPALFPLTIDLPGGGTYAGDPSRFPTPLQLVDDGDSILWS